MILGWGSPVGLGIFLLCLGGMLYFLAKTDEISKRGKRGRKGKK